MTYLEAALSVLRRARRPLTTREVAEAAIRRGLVEPAGKTPEATMSAELYRALRRRTDLVKLAEPGAQRARRGTVRWTVKGGLTRLPFLPPGSAPEGCPRRAGRGRPVLLVRPGHRVLGTVAIAGSAGVLLIALARMLQLPDAGPGLVYGQNARTLGGQSSTVRSSAPPSP